MAEKRDWNASVIAEFRANGGSVGGVFAGRPLLREIPVVVLEPRN